MKFKLSAYTIYEQGPRPRQEDSLFPAHNATQQSDRLFLVCDGMGGHSSGDVASSTVCSALSGHILANVPDVEGAFTDDNFKEALAAAYDALDAKDDGSPKKMGTTMTFLKFHKDGYTIAHIGDSRVYHVRPGADAESTEILFQTQDHSLVNDLVRIGEMTPEEAKTSKQRNVITRAIQPNMERRSRADIAHANDIRPGDYFMLCSDGVLEQMEDDNIKFIFSDKAGDAERKVEMLIRVTENNRDNHTAILVRVDDVVLEAGDVIIPYEKPIIVEEPIVLEPEPEVNYESHDYEPENDAQEDKGLMSKIKPYITPVLIALAVVATGVLAYIFIADSKDGKEQSNAGTIEMPKESGNGDSDGTSDDDDPNATPKQDNDENSGNNSDDNNEPVNPDGGESQSGDNAENEDSDDEESVNTESDSAAATVTDDTAATTDNDSASDEGPVTETDDATNTSDTDKVE